jgi:hypothetical protein
MKDITVDITAPTRYLLRTTRRVGMVSYKSAKVRFDHRTTVQGVRFPIVFRLDEETLTRTFSQFYVSDGNQSITLRGNVEAEFDLDDTTDGTEVLIEIKAVGRWWNQVLQEWVDSFYANRFDMNDAELSPEGKQTMRATINLETGLIPNLPGDAIEITFYTARNFADPVVQADFTDFRDFTFTLENPSVEEGQNTAIDYRLIQSTNARGRYDDGVIWFSDGPTAYARSAISRDSEGAELTSAWRYPGGSPIIHANILLKEVMDRQRARVRGLTADLLGKYKPNQIVNVDNAFHFFIGGNQGGKSNTWKANLFQVATFEPLVSNGRYVTSSAAIFNQDKIFQYRDVDGSVIADFVTANVGDAFYGLEWHKQLSDESGKDVFIYCDGNGNVGKLEINGSSVIRTVFNTYPGGSGGIDIDEEGNIYTAHLSSDNGVRKTSPAGVDLVPAGTTTTTLRKVVVDGEYVYAHNNGASVVIEKRNRDTLVLVGQTSSLDLSGLDEMIVFPEYILHLRRSLTASSNIIRKIRKSDMAIVKSIVATDFSTLWRRMVQDENGIVYVLSFDRMWIFDDDLNAISNHDLGFTYADEIAICTNPVNRIYVRSTNPPDYEVRTYDRDTLAFVSTFGPPGHGPLNEQGRLLNAHPGRVAIKNKVLGL